MAEHDVDSMSTRELKAVIADLQDRLESKQIDMQEVINEQDAEEARRMQAENDSLRAQLKAAKEGYQAAIDTAKTRTKESERLKKELEQARTEGKTNAAKAAESIKALEDQLEEAKAAAPETREVIPEEVEEELKRLREQKARGEAEQAARSAFDMLKTAFDTLENRLRTLEAQDGDVGARYRAAFAKGMRLMADNIAEE